MRAIEVIKRAAQEFGWPVPSLPDNYAVRFAFSRYKNIMGQCAIALALKYEGDTRAVQVIRAVAVVDCAPVGHSNRSDIVSPQIPARFTIRVPPTNLPTV